ncbi:MAG: hypothetical protein JWQ08_2101 [Deinococcus sp.]|nr:hypothetical protein [Deinococcus sp.]
MKILLILLLMVALIGGWYVWTSTRTNNVIANGDTGSGPVPVEGAPAGGEGNTGATTETPTETSPPLVTPGTTGEPAGTVEAGTENPDGSVASGGTVTIPTLPPLGNSDGTLGGPNGEGTTAAPATPEPGGINPDTPLVLLPGVNPFRPLTIDADASGAGTTPTTNVTATTPPPTTPSTTGSSSAGDFGSSSTGPASSSNVDSLGTDGGAVAISPIPGSGNTVSGDSVGVDGGAFPLPTIPGSDGGTTALPSLPTGTPDTAIADNGDPSGSGTVGNDNSSGSGTPDSGTAASGTPDSGTAASGANATDTNGTDTVSVTPPVAPPLPPIKPPVAGVNVPGVSRVPNLTATATPTPGTATSTAPGVTASLPTAAPRPGTPQVITELAPISTGTPAETTRPLDQTIAGRELAFNAVVLGPVNTAIFRSKDGFLVVSVGQTLPDSDIVIKEVTATSATLALGNDTQTLELDKR